MGGGGVGLRIGYGFSDLFTLYLDLGGASVEGEEDDVDIEATLAYGELGGEFTFGSDAQQWRPFVNVALQGYGIGEEDDGNSYAYAGGGLKLGGGVSYFVTPQFALRGSVDLSGGQISIYALDIDGDEEDFDVEDASYSLARAHLGVTYRF